MTELEKIKEVLPSTIDIDTFHPMDIYVELDKLGNWECKAIAEKLNIPYKNKRIFSKLLINKIQDHVQN